MQQQSEIKQALFACKEVFLLTGFFSCVINLLMLTSPLFMLQVYDRVLASGSISTLIALFLLVVWLFLIMGMLEFVRSRIMVRIGTRFDRKLSSRIFDVMIRQSTESRQGTRPINELTTLRQFISGSALFILFDIPWIPIYLGIMFLFHWNIGMVGLIGGIILGGIAVLNDLYTRKPLQESAKISTYSNQLADSILRNADVVYSMGLATGLKKIWGETRETALQKQAEGSDKAALLSAGTKVFRLVLQSTILAVGAALAVQQLITPGSMIVGSILMGRALQPIEQAVAQWKGFVPAYTSYQFLSELLNKIPPIADRLKLPPPSGKLDVINLTFGLPGNKQPILYGLNFSLQPGQAVGVIGPTAAGKSTLARLLVGLRVPSAGEIRLDNATLAQSSPEDLGKYIGYLPQDIELFSGSIAQNISRFMPDSSEELIVQAAKQAGVHDLILHLPDGYETKTGEQGANLSGGHRQRIGLARALYGEPCLIVLDEPNSSLDIQGEQALAAAISDLRSNNKTVIIMAHRQSIIEAVDYLMLLDQGQIQIFDQKEVVLKKLMPAKPQKTMAQSQS